MGRKQKIQDASAIAYLVNAMTNGAASRSVAAKLKADFDIEVSHQTVIDTYENVCRTFDESLLNDEALAKKYRDSTLDVLAELRKSVGEAIQIKDELIAKLRAAGENDDTQEWHYRLKDLNFTWDRLGKFMELLLRVEQKLVNTTVILDKSKSVEMLYDMLAHWLDQKKIRILDPGIKMKVEAKRKKKVKVEA